MSFTVKVIDGSVKLQRQKRVKFVLCSGNRDVNESALDWTSVSFILKSQNVELLLGSGLLTTYVCQMWRCGSDTYWKLQLSKICKNSFVICWPSWWWKKIRRSFPIHQTLLELQGEAALQMETFITVEKKKKKRQNMLSCFAQGVSAFPIPSGWTSLAVRPGSG